MNQAVVTSFAALILFLGACSKTSIGSNPQDFQAALAAAATPDAVDQVCMESLKRLNERHAALGPLKKANPVFRIQGDIRDTEPTSVQVWGIAVVPPTSGYEHWASSGAQRNIVVLNPKNTIHNPAFYVGDHYFVKKDSGKNGFGADVPVWVFGDPPDDLAIVLADLKVLDQRSSACLKRLDEIKGTMSTRPTTPPTTVSAEPQRTTQSESPSPSQPVSSAEAQPISGPDGVSRPSFDCAKATSPIESKICTDPLLGRLDVVLASNYRMMLASDIGDGATSDLKATQKQWVIERNRCSSQQCLVEVYRRRITEVCDYPVLSGVHPNCASSDAIN
jgi:uncharacterized protein YecT (DUF1311 family)